MKQDEEIRDELVAKEHSSTEDICRLLREHESDIHSYLAQFVASICDVDVDRMMNDGGDNARYTAQCRWLFWLSYRYLTSEPYGKMAERLGKYGKKFTTSGINFGVNKMSQMVDEDTVWKKRWIMVKRIVRIYNESTNIPLQTERQRDSIKIVIHKPADVDVKVEFKNE